MASSTKLKLEVKTTDSEVARFISSEKNAEIVLAPKNNNSTDFLVIGTSTDNVSSNTMHIGAYLGTEHTDRLATFTYTNTDLATTAIIKGDVFVEGSALSLGTLIMNDENDFSFQNSVPRSENSNLITERYSKLLNSNIYNTSNQILHNIQKLFIELTSNIDEVLSASELFEDITFTSFGNTDFDRIFALKTTNELADGTSNTFIINNTYNHDLKINTDIICSNININILEAAHISADKIYGDGSQLLNIDKGDGTTSTIREGSNLYFTTERVVPIVESSNINVSNYIDSVTIDILNLYNSSEIQNSNYVITSYNNWYTYIQSGANITSNNIGHHNIYLQNVLTVSNLNINNTVSLYELIHSNMVMQNNINALNYTKTTSNNTSKYLTESIALSSSNLLNIFTNYNGVLQVNSNLLFNTMNLSSNNLIITADKNALYSSNYIFSTSNNINIASASLSIHHSNVLSNALFYMNDLLQNSKFNMSNITLNAFNNIHTNTINNKIFHETFLINASNMLVKYTSNDFQNISNYTNSSFLNLSNMVLTNYNYASNYIMNTSNVSKNIYDTISGTLNNSITNLSNYILNSSNTFTIETSITTISNTNAIQNTILDQSNLINTRLNELTCDQITEGTSKYFTFNLFNQKIQALTLDSINNGSNYKYIQNNIYPSNLTVTGVLTASNLNVIGSETVLFTNAINTGQLEIMSSAFGAALTLKQNISNSNIIQIKNNDDVIFIITQEKIGIKTQSDPEYELDVNGNVKADSFSGSGMYMTNIYLGDKTTSELSEGANNMYFTSTRASQVINYSNIDVTNYTEYNSNIILNKQQDLIQKEKEYTDITSNLVSIHKNLDDLLQSNYIVDNNIELVTNIGTFLLNRNQSNYVNQSISMINTTLDLINNDTSNYILSIYNTLTLKLDTDKNNNKGYLDSTSNLNKGRLDNLFESLLTNINGTSNEIYGRFLSDNASQSNNILITSNTLSTYHIPLINLNMSNYVLSMSNMSVNKFLSNDVNNSNYIRSSSNLLTLYVLYNISNIQASAVGNIDPNTLYLNRWKEPENYILDRDIYTVPFNYLQYIEGNVGIGVTKPTATFEIYTGNASSNSVKVNNNIWAQSGVIYSSDARIKKDIVDINDNTALNQILSIEPKIYDYIDVRRTQKDVYGFIAQQIAEIIPYAVKTQQGYLPDIQCNATLYQNDILMINDEINELLIEDELLCIIYDCSEYIMKIEAVYSENTFKLSSTNGIRGSVFVYGRVVNDFNVLDKNYIYTLGVCSTQDLCRHQASIEFDINSLSDKYYLNQMSNNSNIIQNDTQLLHYLYECHNHINNVTNDNIGDHDELKNSYHHIADIVTSNININDLEKQLQDVKNNNLKLKSQNEMIHQSNSMLQNKINILSDKISNIRGILQRNNII